MASQQDSPCRILVLASGFGSNFQALIDAVASGRIPNSRIIGLVTNRRNIHATVRAETAGQTPLRFPSGLISDWPLGIPWNYFNLISNGFIPKGEKDEKKVADARQKYDAALAERVLSANKEKPELIVLAGWMYIFSSAFLEPMEQAGIKVINLHPALPGKCPDPVPTRFY